MTSLLDDLCIEPVALGPTWQRNPDWDGSDPFDEFVLPEITLGWQILDWVKANCLSDEVDELGKPKPFKPTREQTRFILWWYAIDHLGRFVYRKGILQRLKGWGKDPLAAILCAVEFVGPCRFAGWAIADDPELGVEAGDPVAVPHPRAWIQVAAVSKDQTRNTMTLFPGLFTEECKKEHSIDIGKEVIYAHHGQRRIEAVTSSPRALEGGRPTFVVKNETHHWLANNEGHEMASVIGRNATKSKSGAARSLSITNAYEPSENSVAQQEREAWENENAGLTISTGVLYDSLEAPEGASLTPRKPTRDAPETSEAEVREYLAAVIRAVRGDAIWLDVESIVNAILDKSEPPSKSRRFWFNQVVAAEDAWVLPEAVTAAIDTLARQNRLAGGDELRCGWDQVLPDDEIVAFFDGSKSDDSTAIVGCRLEDGYVFTIGVWQKPPGERGKSWLSPRGAVDSRVQEMFERFNVVAFWGDPSHTLDDEDGSRYWDGLMDDWMRRYKDRLDPAYWPLKSGLSQHAIIFDMTSPERQRTFVAAAETFVEEMESLNDIEEPEPQFKIDGHPALVAHLRNARRYPMRFGVSLMKDGRESSKKIDLAVCAVGARLLRRVVLNKGLEEKSEPAVIWGAW